MKVAEKYVLSMIGMIKTKRKNHKQYISNGRFYTRGRIIRPEG